MRFKESLWLAVFEGVLLWLGLVVVVVALQVIMSIVKGAL